MQKVKITSTSFIKRPKALENIDVSYGVSYFCIKSMEVKTLSNKNSWAIKILSKIEKLSNLFKSKIEEDNQIINQIMEDSNFISTHQQECAKDLHIQINSETKLKNTLTSLADLDYSNRNLVQDGLDSKAGKIYSTTKKMFLGLNFFKKGESFFDSLIKNFSLKETVSFVYFHEYSHSAELIHNSNYGKEKTNSSLDKLYLNLCFLLNDKNYDDLMTKLIADDNIFSIPYRGMIHSLQSLHKEIYADVGSLLLLRNKMILNGGFESERFEEMISHIIQVRKEEKKLHQEFSEINKKEYGFLMHDHFTSPGVEALLTHVKNLNKNDLTILSEEDIHKISCKCVTEGVSKTLLSYIEADNMIIPQLNTIFSMRIDNDKIVLDNTKNHYKDAITKIREIVPKEWQENLDSNVNLLDKTKDSNYINQKKALIFDAGLDSQEFNIKLNSHIKIMSELTYLFDDIIPIKKEVVSSDIINKEITSNASSVQLNIKKLRDKNLQLVTQTPTPKK